MNDLAQIYNLLAGANNNINVVNDNVVTLFQKISESKSVDTTPLLTDIIGVMKSFSVQMNANTEALNQLAEIVKAIPGATIPEQVQEEQTKAKKK